MRVRTNWLGQAIFPSSVRRGGRDIKKNGAKPPYLERTGWSLTRHVAGMHSETCVVSDHPVCAVSVASQHLLTGATTPPHGGGEYRRIRTLREFVSQVL